MGPGWDLVGSSAFTGKNEVRSLVGELRSHMPESVVKLKKKKIFFLTQHLHSSLPTPCTQTAETLLAQGCIWNLMGAALLYRI